MDPDYPPCMSEVDLTPSRVVARRFRLARQAMNMTQSEMAAKSGMPQTTISAWERAIGFRSLDAAARTLARAGYPDASILCGDDPRGDAPPDEVELLKLYRSLPEGDRSLVLQMIKLQAAHRAI